MGLNLNGLVLLANMQMAAYSVHERYILMCLQLYEVGGFGRGGKTHVGKTHTLLIREPM